MANLSDPSERRTSSLLLEREAELVQLRGYLDEAAQGRGSLVLLGGNAGVGKTVLVREFCGSVQGGVRVLVGACDALSTPHPLAPMLDVVGMLGEQASRLMDAAQTRQERFRTFLSLLSDRRRPSLVVFEDVHWADEATLDLLRFVGRRIEATRALLIVTYRADEVGPGHPLRIVFGDLASLRTTHRLALPPLTEQAVATLAEGSEVDAAELYRLTGGNPFFVTEVLAAGGAGIPATVRDAVLARVARLSNAGRATLNAAAVIGSPAELWLLDNLVEDGGQGIEECIASGMLHTSGDALAFRHEIARETVLDAQLPPSRTSLHRKALAALEGSPEGRGTLARLAHHAEEARDREAVLRYAPAAGRDASSLNAHREAAAQFARALRCADGLAPAERALLLEDYARECKTIDRADASIKAHRDALEIWRAERNALKEGENLDRQANVLVGMGRNAEAEEASRDAIRVLESLPPSTQLAMAYRGQAHLRMLNRDSAEAISWGNKAIELAGLIQDETIRIATCNSMGAAMLVADDDGGRVLLEQTLELASQAGLDGEVALAYGNLGSALGEFYRFPLADSYLAEGIAFCGERDLDAQRLYMLAWQALSHFYQGRWSEAAETAIEVTRRPWVSTISRIMALVALGRVRARRGDPDVMPALDEALELASQTATLQRLAPVHAARAEAAWLRGDQGQTAQEFRAVFELALSKRHPWFIGELAYWRWKAGDFDRQPEPMGEPFALQIAGDWQAAAASWRALNCPYEAARALVESDDEAALRQALDEFDRLGAAPARAEVAQRLREIGARSIPRGARASTRANPAGLTTRQVEVAQLVAAGCSNAEIAERLFISPKTVEHHVSALFAKLGASSRVEAAREAERLGITT